MSSLRSKLHVFRSITEIAEQWRESRALFVDCMAEALELADQFRENFG